MGAFCFGGSALRAGCDGSDFMKFFETLLVGLMRAPLIGGAVASGLDCFNRLAANAMKRVASDQVRPRSWSNQEIRKIGKLVGGRVLNVSGWRDEDKNGGHYRDYFVNAERYDISNYSGESGVSGLANEVFLDLEKELPEELKGQYDVVFNHTTLEHVFDIRKAIANICALSRDTVIVVTPFLQQVHYIEGSFGDWWRPTPMCMTRLLEEQGFSVVYQSHNDNPWYIVYLITVASRHPERFAGKLASPEAPPLGTKHFRI